jgi:hypothetical protein
MLFEAAGRGGSPSDAFGVLQAQSAKTLVTIFNVDANVMRIPRL